MPALYPENVQYSSPEKKFPTILGNLNKSDIDQGLNQIISSIQRKAQQKMSGGRSLSEIIRGSSTIQNNYTGGYKPYPIEYPFLKSKEKLSDIPKINVSGSEYKILPTDKEGRWVSPTGTAKVYSVPETLGGGQYIMDSSLRGKLIKSERSALTDPDIFNALPTEDKIRINNLKLALTGGMPNIDIDHIEPLWAGGVDSFENLQPIRSDEHYKKTKIQSVPLTLLSHGKIDKNKALLMSRQWKYISENFDVDRVPDPYSDIDEGKRQGTIDLAAAEQLAKEWEKVPPVTFKKFWNNIPVVSKEISENIAKMSREKLPSFLAGGVEGLAQELSLGVIPVPEAKTTGEQFGQYAGTILGFIIPFKAITAVGRGIMGGLGFGKALGFVASKTKGIKGIGPIVGGIEKAGIGAKETIGKKIPSAVKIEALPFDESTKSGKIPVLVKGNANRDNIIGNAINNAATFMGYGQFRLAVPSLFGYEDPGFEKRMKQATLDTLLGGATGILTTSFRDTAKLGAGTLIASMMERYSEGSEDIFGDSIVNAVTMMALHKMPEIPGRLGISKGLAGMSVKQRADAEKMWLKTYEKEINKIASQTSVEHLKQYLPNKYDFYSEKKIYPKLTEVEANSQRVQIKKQLDSLLKDDRITPEIYERKLRLADLATRQLWKEGLAEPIRMKEDVKDIHSVSKKVFDEEKGLTYGTPKEIESIVNHSDSDSLLFPKEDVKGLSDKLFPDSQNPNIRFPLTGLSGDINPTIRNNWKLYAEAEKTGNASPVLIIYSRGNLEPLIRNANAHITKDEIKNLIKAPSTKPWNNEEAFATIRDKNGNKIILNMGYIARGKRIEGLANSFNRVFDSYKMESTKYNPEHNKDFIAEEGRKRNAPIKIAYIYKTALGKEEVQVGKIKERQPFLEARMVDKSWEDTERIKPWYKNVPKNSKDAVREANENTTPENAQRAVEILAKERYLDPIKELEIKIEKGNIKNTTAAFSTLEITKFFREVFSGDPKLFRGKINKKYGEIVDDAIERDLIENFNTKGLFDITKLLDDGIKNKTGNKQAKLDKNILFKFISSPDFGVLKDISSYYSYIPVVGIGKKTKPEIIVDGNKISKNDILQTTEPKPKETITTKKGVPLEKEILPSGQYWLEQNVAKEGSKWAKLAKEGHKIEHLMDTRAPKNGYVGKIRIDGKEFTYDQAEKKFLKTKGIYDSAVVAEEPDAISTPAAKSGIVKKITKRTLDESNYVYKQLYTNGKQSIDEISAGPERVKYISSAARVLNNLDVKYDKKSLSEEQYNKIKNTALDDLKAEVLGRTEEFYPINEEIRFQRGSVPNDPVELKKERESIKFENENLLNIKKSKATKEELEEEAGLTRLGKIKEKITAKQELSPDELDFLVHKEGVTERISPKEEFVNVKEKWEETEKKLIEEGKKQEEIQKIKDSYWKNYNDKISIDSKEYSDLLNSTIKSSLKSSPGYISSKSFNDYLSHIWGANWKENISLSKFFNRRNSVGASFWKKLFWEKNEHNYPISQPKDVIRALSQKPYDKLTKEERNEIYKERRKETSEIPKRLYLTDPKKFQKLRKQEGPSTEGEVFEEGLRIENPLQSLDKHIKDLTELEARSAGRLSAEIGMPLTAAAILRDNRGFIISLMKEYNISKRKGDPKVRYIEKTMDKIDENIKNEVEFELSKSSRIKSIQDWGERLKKNIESIKKREKTEILPVELKRDLNKNETISERISKVLEKLKKE